MSRDIGQLKEPFQSSVRELVKRAKEKGIPILITDTTRTLEEQKEFVRKGYSRTLKSKHLTGEAVDIAFEINGRLIYSQGLYEKLYREIVKGLPYVIWPFRDLGWDWDPAHHQFDINKKGVILTDMEKAEYEKTIEDQKLEIRKINTENGENIRLRDHYKKYKKRYYDEVESHESTIDHLKGCKKELNSIASKENRAVALLKSIGGSVKDFFTYNNG